MLVGCRFEPDLELLVVPTAPSQPFSQFASSTSSVPTLAAVTPQPAPYGLVPPGTITGDGWVAGAVAGTFTAVAAGAGILLWRGSQLGARTGGAAGSLPVGGPIHFRPRIRRLVWVVPVGAGLLSFGIAARSCSAPEICYQMVGGVQVVVPCEMLQGEGQVEATATPECSAEEESRHRQSIEEIARSTENRLADHLTIADLQAARQAFQTGVDPAGRKHLQEVLEAAGGQLDDTKRLRNLQDYLIPRGGCSPSRCRR